MKQIGHNAQMIGRTPAAVGQNRKLAEALIKQGTSAEPVQHWTQALARVAQAGNGALHRYFANENEQKGQASANEALAQALAGGSMSDAASSLMSNPWSAQQGQQLAVQAIGQRELAARADARHKRATEARIAQENRAFGRQKELIDYRNQAPTAFAKNYEFAKQNGFAGTPADFKRSGAMSVNVGAGETAYDKQLGKKLADDFLKFQTDGAKASRDMGDLKVMQQAIADPNLYTGTGGNAVHALKKTAQTLFGVDVKGVASGEIVQRTANKAALALKDELPGPMSNADREFLMNIPANLSTSPEGARQVIQLGIARKQWEMERSQAALRFAQQNGGRLTAQVYGALADVDKKWGQQMSGLVQELRAQTPEPVRAPTAGVPAFEPSKTYKFGEDFK